MAGDWLKFECNLPEKPETLAITTALGWEDPDITVGKLMRLFRWFDQHTLNGNAVGVTSASLDRVIGVAGFAKAVENVGWLVFDSAGVTLQKFDRHNGTSAKSRAQTAKRVASFRGKTEESPPETLSQEKGNAAIVTPALAREEKSKRRRNTPLTPQGGQARFPEFWLTWPKNDRKQDKAKCQAMWASAGLDALADAIVADVKAKRGTAKWRDGYVEAPAVYLHNRRWEDADGATAGDWWLTAGFVDRFEAENSKCFAHNAGQFRNGKRTEEPA